MKKTNSHTAMESGPCLEFSGVSFQYNSQAVIENVTFAAGRGEFIAILGPNGSGKNDAA